MHFTLQQLKIFEAVSRLNSYTHAAQELHITQPAVSIQVKRLENQVGLPLLEQIGKKIFLTPAGKLMYEASSDILLRVENTKRNLDALKGSVKGDLQVSVVTTAKYFMPHLLGNFLQQYSEVEPKLKFTNRARLIERLINNQDDFVVMGQMPTDNNLEMHPLFHNVLGIVAPVEHPLAKQKNIPLEQLAKERFLQREPGSGTQIMFNQLLKEKNIAIETHMELGSSEALKQAVMARLGIAVLSLHSIQLERDAKKLTVLDVEGFPLKRMWYAAHLKDRKLPLVARKFLDYILEECQNFEKLEYLQHQTDNTISA
jgi:LysR family transcriptional regulator, low CO2-responsive transcriptional regulator